ncbi:MAG: mitochondrial fission ELM1 family protein [Micropepsaceae bacterium]
MNEPAVENVTWGISDGRAGMANQVRGLAEALGLPVQVKTVHPGLPWTLLPVTMWPAPFGALGAGSSTFVAPWPKVVIGCGWRSIPYVLAVKRLSSGKTYAVQLQDPRIDPSHFDLVVPPEHDDLKGANVEAIIGSPNAVTRTKLDAAANQWRVKLSALKQPRIAVLVGGKSKTHRFAEIDAQNLAAQLKQLDARGLGLMVTTSRRTGEAQTRIIKEALADTQAFLWDGTGDNPYFGLLALADVILVTSDSTNMAVEAAATGKPVYIVDLPGGDPKFDCLHNALEQRGIARKFTGEIAQWSYEPLNETARIAALIRRKIGLSPR